MQHVRAPFFNECRLCEEVPHSVIHTFSASLNVASLDELIHGLFMPFSLHAISQCNLQTGM